MNEQDVQQLVEILEGRGKYPTPDLLHYYFYGYLPYPATRYTDRLDFIKSVLVSLGKETYEQETSR